MNRLFALALALAASLGGAPKDLTIRFVDVEGGQATLVATPAGESMLIDAGFPGLGGRDAGRIAAAAKELGLSKIDYLVVTHYHLDHVGGVADLAAKIPVGTFVDHGPNMESGKDAEALNASYAAAVAKGKHLVVKPGDKIPLKGADVVVVTANGSHLAAPLPGAGQSNPLCAAAAKKAADPSENARSLGVLITYGKFRMIDLGDLTWNKELELACPANLIGPVDLYLTTHHGMDISGPAALVHALRPRVGIMNNGARKGGTPEAWKTVKASPGLEDLWQVHFAVAGGAASNVPADQIANPEEACKGFGLAVTAKTTGAFAVENLRNGVRKQYASR